MNIRAKITLSMLGLALMSISTLSIAAYYYSKDSVIDAREHELHALLSSQKNHMEHVVQSWKDRATILASRTQMRVNAQQFIKEGGQEKIDKITRFLTDGVNSSRFIRGARICTLDGKELAAVIIHGNETECYALADDPMKTYVHHLDYSKYDSHVTVVTPMEIDGDVFAVMNVTFGLEEIFAVTQNYDGLGKTGEILLLEKTQDELVRFLVPPRHEEYYRDIFTKLNSVRILNLANTLSKENKVAVTDKVADYRGKHVFAAVAMIDQTGWLMVAKIDRDEAMKVFDELFEIILTAALFFIFVTIVVAVYLSNTLSKPIVTIAERMDAIRGGELDSDIPFLQKRDEVGMLARNTREFKRTIVSLHDAREKAEEASRLKSDFLSTMSHEIRTPINGILGMTELILSAQPNDKIRNYAQTVLHSIESLMHIINDILDFSKLEAGKLDITSVPVNMVDLVDEVCAVNSVAAAEHAIELVVDYKPATAQFVLADPVRIRQVLSNFLSNAIKFTKEGHIHVLVEEEQNAFLESDKVMMKFSVKDTGLGIEPEALETVFEKFIQADSSTTRKFGGTGLGLSICKSLVELMDGEIGVESTPGKGSNFWFKVPLKRNEKYCITSTVSDSLDGVRILAVDDLNVVGNMVSEILNSAGARCNYVTNVKDAMAELLAALEANDPYEMVIIDYMMPGENGYMLSSNIYDYPELRKACLVMLTGADSPISDEKFVETGFSAYIPKPVKKDEFVQKMELIWTRYSDGETTGLIDTDLCRIRAHDESEEVLLRGIDILVAEDNFVNQAFVKEILKETQCSYTIVSNGQEAVDMVAKNHYDLVIMDCLMPILDGYKATQKICALKAEGKVDSKLPIIALTANAMVEDKKRCKEAGMNAYLSKPIRKEIFKKVLHCWIYGGRRELEVFKDYYMDFDNIYDVDAYRSSPVTQQAGEEEASHSNEEATLDASEVVESKEREQAEIIASTQAVEASVESIEIAEILEAVDMLPAEIPILDEKEVAYSKSLLKEGYDNVLATFFENIESYVEQIEQALEERNVELLTHVSHTIKSSSRQMGAARLSECAKDIEMKAKSISYIELTDDDIAFVKERLTTLLQLFEQTKQAFGKL